MRAERSIATSADYPNAEKYFGLAIKYYPDFDDAEIGLATAYLAEDKAKEAIPALRKAIAIDQKNEVSWYRLSQAERSVGDLARTEAKPWLSSAVCMRPSSRRPIGLRLTQQPEVTRQTIGVRYDAVESRVIRSYDRSYAVGRYVAETQVLRFAQDDSFVVRAL
jgi:tetratricopeptide (TPR) repeat protein